jgi:hypothetical protein
MDMKVNAEGEGERAGSEVGRVLLFAVVSSL